MGRKLGFFSSLSVELLPFSGRGGKTMKTTRKYALNDALRGRLYIDEGYWWKRLFRVKRSITFGAEKIIQPSIFLFPEDEIFLLIF